MREGHRENWTDWGRRGGPPGAFPKLSPEAEADRSRAMADLMKLTPEQREKIWQTVIAVMNLPEDKRAELLTSEEDRRKKGRETIEAAMKELQVPEDKKWPFIRAYFHGRRALEEKIRQETDKEREKGLAEMMEKLRQDFGPQAQQDVKQNVKPNTPAPEKAAPSPK